MLSLLPFDTTLQTFIRFGAEIGFEPTCDIIGTEQALPGISTVLTRSMNDLLYQGKYTLA